MQEAEGGGSQVQGQPGLQSQFKAATLGNLVRDFYLEMKGRKRTGNVDHC